MALGSIFILAVLVQFRTIILIASWSLVFFLFQAEEKLIRAIAALLSISFTGYLKSGFKIRRVFFGAERWSGNLAKF